MDILPLAWFRIDMSHSTNIPAYHAYCFHSEPVPKWRSFYIPFIRIRIKSVPVPSGSHLINETPSSYSLSSSTLAYGTDAQNVVQGHDHGNASMSPTTNLIMKSHRLVFLKIDHCLLMNAIHSLESNIKNNFQHLSKWQWTQVLGL